MRDDGAAGNEQLVSVANALRILRMLKTEPTVRVTDVSRALDISASTAHRLLNTMRQLGFVEQEPRGRAYRAGWELVEMGLESAGRLEIRDHARPILTDLRDEFNETSNLLVIEGRFVRFIDGVESRNPVRVAIRVGQRIEAHGTAAGKVLLAERSDTQIRSLFEDGSMAAATPSTIVSIERFLGELATVRSQGYATNLGESVRDLHAVGVKVVNATGHAVAALTVSAPANRLRTGNVRAVAAALMLASARLSRTVWGSPPVVSA